VVYRNINKRWAVTLESRLSFTFTHETTPFNKKQNKESNPYLERSDKLFLGGYEPFADMIMETIDNSHNLGPNLVASTICYLEVLSFDSPSNLQLCGL
jgi:hypothetical protein